MNRRVSLRVPGTALFHAADSNCCDSTPRRGQKRKAAIRRPVPITIAPRNTPSTLSTAFTKVTARPVSMERPARVHQVVGYERWGPLQVAEGATVEDVGVDHGGGDVAVAEELLDGANVVAGLKQVGREGVPQGDGGRWVRMATRTPAKPCQRRGQRLLGSVAELRRARRGRRLQLNLRVTPGTAESGALLRAIDGRVADAEVVDDDLARVALEGRCGESEVDASDAAGL